MIIPREDGLVRIYCQLVTVGPSSDERFDRSRITPDTILEAAQRIIKPYTLEFKYHDWWTVYRVSSGTRTDMVKHALAWLTDSLIARLVKGSGAISVPTNGSS